MGFIHIFRFIQLIALFKWSKLSFLNKPLHLQVFRVSSLVIE